jgi:hypothetical protein
MSQYKPVAFLEVLPYQPAFVLPVFAEDDGHAYFETGPLYTQSCKRDVIVEFDKLHDRRQLLWVDPNDIRLKPGDDVLYAFKFEDFFHWGTREALIPELMKRRSQLLSKPMSYAQVFDMIFEAPHYEDSPFLHGNLSTYLGALVFEINAKGLRLTAQETEKILREQPGARKRDITASFNAAQFFSQLELVSKSHDDNQFAFISSGFESWALLEGLRSLYTFVGTSDCIRLEHIQAKTVKTIHAYLDKEYPTARILFYLCRDPKADQLFKTLGRLRHAQQLGKSTVPIYNPSLTRLAPTFIKPETETLPIGAKVESGVWAV